MFSGGVQRAFKFLILAGLDLVCSYGKERFNTEKDISKRF